MAYNKTVWVNDSTPAINATNLNNIENGIEALDNTSTSMAGSIATNTTNIDNLQTVATATFTNDKTSLAGGVLALDTINSTSDKLTLSGSGIRIGAGISKVLVSGNVFFQFTAADQNYLYMQIRKNTTAVSIAIGAEAFNYAFISLSFTPVLVEVQEGDIFYIVSTEGRTGTYRGGQNSWLTIQVVE